MTHGPGDQILKTRDDHAPVFLQSGNAPDPSGVFMLSSGATCSWARAGESIGPEKLRPRIEPWLTALVQSEHLGLLIGSGLTHAVHRLAIDQALPGMDVVTFRELNDEITRGAKRAAKAAGRENGNFEDQIRVAIELLRGLEIMSAPTGENSEDDELIGSLKVDLKRVLQSFADSILAGERSLVTADAGRREKAFNYLVSFLMSFASRTGP